jgi:hypothetical protein
MGKVFKRLFITLGVLIVLVGGAVWWLLSYIAPDKQLDLNYSSIDLKEKAMDMARRLEPELILTESDVNNLIKKHLHPDVADGVRLDGAQFHLSGDRLIADLNVTYRERISAQLQAEYRMEWQEPNLTLRPQSLSVKGIELPIDLLDTIIVPLDLQSGELVFVQDVRFESKQVKVLFKINMPF